MVPPWATHIGRERNPQANKIPVLTDSDMVALLYDDSGVSRTTFKDRLKIAREAGGEMEADETEVIERDVVDHK